jgi:hypothetical protein
MPAGTAPRDSSVAWLSDKHGHLYGSDNGSFSARRERASGGLSGSSETKKGSPQTRGLVPIAQLLETEHVCPTATRQSDPGNDQSRRLPTTRRFAEA